MPQQNKDIIWKYLLNLEKLSNILENDFLKKDNEICKQINILKNCIDKKDYSKFNEEEVKSFCIKKWEPTIKKAIKNLAYKINHRKTRGENFIEIQNQLEKLEMDIDVGDYEIENYLNIYEEDLKKSFGKQIKEKINIENYNKKEFWKGIIIGAVLGFIFGIWIPKM